MMLETKRLVMRPFEEKDLQDFHEYAKDPKVGPPAGWKTHATLEESKDILGNFMAGDEVFALVEKASGKVVGSLGLHEDRKREYKGAKMVGYVLSSRYWGKGYMPEALEGLLAYAFETLQLNLVSAYHYPFNVQSQRVLEKAGFHFEGVLRACSILVDGEIVDDRCYSMKREEYFNIREALLEQKDPSL
ncbi:MAG TPA: GNAT family N-acetyltransferase [Clostridiaceae bacterium]|nr:GNAT family N-acetyltransferase [Clostridiaceae bacterium]